jgi:hypothetical protein
MRNSARWEELFIIGSSILGIIVLSQFLKKYSYAIKFIVIGILLGVIFAEYMPSLTFQSLPEVKSFPPEYGYINSTPDAKVIEMPIYNWNVFPYSGQEYIRQYFSITGFKPRVNGVSGFSPPPWQNLVTYLLKTFPNGESLSTLKKLGVNTIIVHPQEYTMLYQNKLKVGDTYIKDGKSIIKVLDSSANVTKIKKYSSAVIYRLH